MKLFQKLTAVCLLLTLLVSLTACGMTVKEKSSDADRQKLQAILNDLSNNLHPGTAGSSLTAAQLTAELLAWAATTKMDKKEAAGIVAEWLKEQSPEIQAAFQEKMQSVSNTYGQVLKDGAADLMESAGINKDFSNLGSRLKELVGAVLASGGLD